MLETALTAVSPALVGIAKFVLTIYLVKKAFAFLNNL